MPQSRPATASGPAARRSTAARGRALPALRHDDPPARAVGGQPHSPSGARAASAERSEHVAEPAPRVAQRAARAARLDDQLQVEHPRVEGVQAGSRRRPRRRARRPGGHGWRARSDAAGERVRCRGSRSRITTARARRMRASKPSAVEQLRRRPGRVLLQRAEVGVRAGAARAGRAAIARAAPAAARCRGPGAAAHDQGAARGSEPGVPAPAALRVPVTIGHPCSNGARQGRACGGGGLRARGARQQPRKLFFPEPGFTKMDLVNYYLECEEAVVRHLRERPTVMKRWVDGVQGEPFFQKRVPDSAPGLAADRDGDLPERPPRARARPQRRRPSGLGREPRGDRLEPVARAPRPTSTTPTSCGSTSTPARGCRSRRCARSRSWCARCSRSTRCAASRRPRARAASTSTCGSSPSEGFEEVRRAALALAREVERRMPGRATSRWWKEEREGVFIDYNQNARDRTVASAYSVRAVPDARVSCPLEWEEVPDVEPAELRCRPCRRACASSGDPSGDDRRAAPGGSTGCSSSRRATSARVSATRRGRRTSASRQGEPPRVQPSRRARRRRQELSLRTLTAAQRRSWRSRAASSPWGTATATRSSSTASAASRSSTAARSSCSRATAGRSAATSPSFDFPDGRYVLDGEIVVRDADGREDFDALGQRIHPAASRVELLAAQTPAAYVAFDLLALEDEVPLLERPFSERRTALVRLLGGRRVRRLERRADRRAPGTAPARRGGSSTPRGPSRRTARLPTGRASARGMTKVKRVRTIDAVVVGWRPGKAAGHRRRADPRSLRRSRAAGGRPLLRAEGVREAQPGGFPGAV